MLCLELKIIIVFNGLFIFPVVRYFYLLIDIYVIYVVRNRLEKPVYADDKLHDVMKNCWNQKPTARPSFSKLQEILGSFLEDHVRNVSIITIYLYDE